MCKKVCKTFLAGIGGFIAGLLLAPKSGKELRKDIAKKAEELKGRGEEIKEKFEEAKEKIVKEVKKIGEELKK